MARYTVLQLDPAVAAGSIKQTYFFLFSMIITIVLEKHILSVQPHMQITTPLSRLIKPNFSRNSCSHRPGCSYLFYQLVKEIVVRQLHTNCLPSI